MITVKTRPETTLFRRSCLATNLGGHRPAYGLFISDKDRAQVRRDYTNRKAEMVMLNWIKVYPMLFTDTLYISRVHNGLFLSNQIHINCSMRNTESVYQALCRKNTAHILHL